LFPYFLLHFLGRESNPKHIVTGLLLSEAAHPAEAYISRCDSMGENHFDFKPRRLRCSLGGVADTTPEVLRNEKVWGRCVLFSPDSDVGRELMEATMQVAAIRAVREDTK
jgi:hypothetical protein